MLAKTDHAARWMIARYDREAFAAACDRASACERVGSAGAAEIWRQITAAICAIQNGGDARDGEVRTHAPQ